MKKLLLFKCLSAGALWLLFLVAVGQTAPKDVLKNIEDFRKGYTPEALAELKAGKTLAEIVDTMNQRIKEKAEEALKSVDSAKIDAKDAYDYAQIYSLALQHKTVCNLAKEYLSTHLAASEKFKAQILMIGSLNALGDCRALEQTFRVTDPAGTAESLQFASEANRCADSIAKLRGDQSAIRVLDLAAKKLDFSDVATYTDGYFLKYKQIFTSKKEREPNYALPSDETLREQASKSIEDQTLGAGFQLVAKKAELLANDGKHAEALALLEAAAKKLPEGSSVHRTAITLVSHMTLIGNPAPPLKVERKYGEFASLEAWRGKVVVIDTFAHWCGPCKASFPDMEKMFNDLHSKGLEIVSATGFYGSFDTEKKLDQDTEFARMADFRKKYSLTWPMIFDDFTNFKKYGVTGIPTAIVVGRDGKVRSIDTGYSAESFAKFRKEIEKALAES